MSRWMTTSRLSGLKLTAKLGLAVLLGTLSLGRSYSAHADTMMLKAATTMVYGSAADTYSFAAPSAGTVTADISTLPWPVPLTSLSFSATTASNTLASWSSSASTPGVETFQVSGAGTYFAHVMATAGGSLDLGLYSLVVTFAPSAVPLPTAAGLLLIGILVLLSLQDTMRTPATRSSARNENVMSPA